MDFVGIQWFFGDFGGAVVGQVFIWGRSLRLLFFDKPAPTTLVSGGLRWDLMIFWIFWCAVVGQVFIWGRLLRSLFF